MMARKRRGRGEGSIYQRKDGRWVAAASLGGGGATKKRSRIHAYGKTKKEAMDNLSKKVAAWTPAGKETVETILRRWIAEKERTIQEVTVQNYRNVVDNCLIPLIGHRKISTLTPLHIQQLYQDFAKSQVAAGTQNKAAIVLGAALDDSVQHGLIPNNPAHKIPKPQASEHKFRWLDEDEVKLLLAETEGTRLHALFVLALGSGMRIGEMLALDWRDIDWKNNRVIVSKTLEDAQGRPLEVKKAKTKTSHRTIILPQSAMSALEAHRDVMNAEGNGAAPVFCWRCGTHIRGGDVRKKHFHPALERAGLPRIRLHDLRHTHATLLLLAGVSPKVVQERLGHASVATTLDIYSHVLPTMQQDAADKIQGFLE